jgi:hypothetical protein
MLIFSSSLLVVRSTWRLVFSAEKRAYHGGDIHSLSCFGTRVFLNCPQLSILSRAILVVISQDTCAYLKKGAYYGYADALGGTPPSAIKQTPEKGAPGGRAPAKSSSLEAETSFYLQNGLGSQPIHMTPMCCRRVFSW